MNIKNEQKKQKAIEISRMEISLNWFSGQIAPDTALFALVVRLHDCVQMPCLSRDLLR